MYMSTTTQLYSLSTPFIRISTLAQPPGGPLDDYCISDGRIVSGVNPASAASTAELTISVFEKLVV